MFEKHLWKSNILSKLQVDGIDKIELDASFLETQFYIEGYQYSPFRWIVTVYNTVIWPKKKLK